MTVLILLISGCALISLAGLLLLTGWTVASVIGRLLLRR